VNHRKHFSGRAWLRQWLSTAWLFGLGVVAGCGGGGGLPLPGLPLPSPDLTVSGSFDTNEVTATSIDSDTTPQGARASVTVNYKGNRDIYLGVEESQGLLDNYSIDITQPPYRLEMRFKTGRTEGTYTSQLKVLACFVRACKEPAPGSPLLLPLRLVVTPNLKVQPKLELTRTGREAAPVGTVTVGVPPNAGTLSIASGRTFNSGFDVQLQGNVLKVNTEQLRAGRYTGRVEFVASGSSVYRAAVDIVYVVNPPPGGELPLAVVVTDRGPSSVEQGQVFRSRFRVQRPTWIDDKSVPVLADSSGLTKLRDLGGDEFELTLDTAGIGQGTYFNPVVNMAGGSFVDPAEGRWFFQVIDAFTVYAGLSLTLDGRTTPDALRLKAPILSASGQALRWTARSLTPWVRMLRSSGITGQDQIEVELDSVGALSTAASSEGGYLEVSVDRPGTLPVIVGVAVGNNLPRVGPAMRGALLPGAATLYFDGNHPDVDPCMKLSGATLRQFTSANDTRYVGRLNVLRVDLDDAVAGRDVVLRCVTPLLTTEVRVPVRAVPKVAAGYVALPLNTWRSAQFAMSRDALFFAAPGTLARWSLAAGVWTLKTAALPNLIDAALYGDESFLIAVAENNAWRIAADTLSVQAGPVAISNSFGAISIETKPWVGMGAVAFASDGAATVASRTNNGFSGEVRGTVGASGYFAPLTGSFANGNDPGGLFGGSTDANPASSTGVLRSPSGAVVLGQNLDGQLRFYESALRRPRLSGGAPLFGPVPSQTTACACCAVMGC
jgi:hypothetical protein